MLEKLVLEKWKEVHGFDAVLLKDQLVKFVELVIAEMPKPTEVPTAWTNLLEYVLQDDLYNRLTPRVIDIAYTAFSLAKSPNGEYGGPSDWFNDTKPMVNVAISKLRKDLRECTSQYPDYEKQCNTLLEAIKLAEPVMEAHAGPSRLASFKTTLASVKE